MDNEAIFDTGMVPVSSVEEISSAVLAAGSSGEAASIVDAALDVLTGSLHTRLGETEVFLYAGSSTNRKQHLYLHCERLRARSVVRHSVDRYSGAGSFFAADASRRICPTCTESSPGVYVSFLLIGMYTVADRSRDLLSAFNSGPNHARMRQNALRARHAFAAIERDVRLFAAAQGGYLVDASLLATLRGSSEFVEDAVSAEVSPLAWPLHHAAVAVAAAEALYERSSASVSFELEEAVLARLAAVSAAAPSLSSPFRVLPSRKGADVSGLIARKLWDGMEPLFAGFVQDRFDDWVKHRCEDPSGTKPFREDNEPFDHDVDLEPWNLDLAHSFNEWHVEPDLSLGPWGLLVANVRALGKKQLAVLYREWEEHYRWVVEGGDLPSLLIVRDVRSEPLFGLGAIDRYDMLDTVLSRFPAEASEVEGLWFARVPTAYARALDGFSTDSGRIEAAALYDADESRLTELLTMADALIPTFEGRGKLAAAVQAASACV